MSVEVEAVTVEAVDAVMLTVPAGCGVSGEMVGIG
jgi:hypothetical protein